MVVNMLLTSCLQKDSIYIWKQFCDSGNQQDTKVMVSLLSFIYCKFIHIANSKNVEGILFSCFLAILCHRETDIFLAISMLIYDIFLIPAYLIVTRLVLIFKKMIKRHVTLKIIFPFLFKIPLNYL